MTDILDEASALLRCKSCDWYRACVLPVRFNVEDVKKQFEAGTPGLPPQDISNPAEYHLLAGMVSAAQNSMLEGCPVFINRLRSNPKLAERIKKIMQDWASEDSGTAPSA
ncbi:MAG: hypothetical protein Q7T05_08220 [Dehalococcoidia bacterium]|nr:hypothetical protein [Dehalococcoidia bacterium]